MRYSSGCGFTGPGAEVSGTRWNNGGLKISETVEDTQWAVVLWSLDL